MAQLLVTVNDNSQLPRLRTAIRQLRGVEQVAMLRKIEVPQVVSIQGKAHRELLERVNYSPYSHFAKEHSVTMSVTFMGSGSMRIENPPYEAKYTITADTPKGIGRIAVIGTSGKTGDDCYLYESRSVRVQIN